MWRIKAFPKEVRETDEETSATFWFEIRLRCSPMANGDRYGTTKIIRNRE